MYDENTYEPMTDEENDELLPEGWTEDADFFKPSTWSGAEASEEDDFFAEDDEEETVEEGEPETEPEPSTTEEPPAEAEPAAQPGEGTEAPAAPTTEPAAEEPETGKSKLRFKARIDHEDVDAEIDESDLPAIYQKAAVTDRYQEKLAKVSPVVERLERMARSNGYETVEAMLDAQEAYDREQAVAKLVSEGAPKTIAEDYVDRQFGRAAEAKPAEPAEAPAAEPAKTDAPARNLAAEISELWTLRPELKGTTIPSEVAAAAANGQNLVIAYFNYENKQNRAAAETLRKENDIYKQNAAAAAKAPVKGVSGGGRTDTAPEDPFVKGFNDGW